MVFFPLTDIQKNPEGLSFSKKMDLKSDLQARNADILDLKAVRVDGQITYENKMYVLNYVLSYQMTLPSSRSMTPVPLEESYPVSEVFMEEAALKDFPAERDREWILPIKEDRIDLIESVTDHILLNIPLKVLTPKEKEEADFPEGKDWQVMSEDAYKVYQAEKKEATSPFTELASLFED